MEASGWASAAWCRWADLVGDPLTVIPVVSRCAGPRRPGTPVWSEPTTGRLRVRIPKPLSPKASSAEGKEDKPGAQQPAGQRSDANDDRRGAAEVGQKHSRTRE